MLNLFNDLAPGHGRRAQGRPRTGGAPVLGADAHDLGLRRGQGGGVGLVHHPDDEEVGFPQPPAGRLACRVVGIVIGTLTPTGIASTLIGGNNPCLSLVLTMLTCLVSGGGDADHGDAPDGSGGLASGASGGACTPCAKGRGHALPEDHGPILLHAAPPLRRQARSDSRHDSQPDARHRALGADAPPPAHYFLQWKLNRPSSADGAPCHARVSASGVIATGPWPDPRLGRIVPGTDAGLASGNSQGPGERPGGSSGRQSVGQSGTDSLSNHLRGEHPCPLRGHMPSRACVLPSHRSRCPTHKAGRPHPRGGALRPGAASRSDFTRFHVWASLR